MEVTRSVINAFKSNEMKLWLIWNKTGASAVIWWFKLFSRKGFPS